MDTLLTARETAQLLRVHPLTLAAWRATGRYDLPYLHIGRMIRYRLEDVEAFLRQLEFKKGTSGENASPAGRRSCHNS